MLFPSDKTASPMFYYDQGAVCAGAAELPADFAGGRTGRGSRRALQPQRFAVMPPIAGIRHAFPLSQAQSPVGIGSDPAPRAAGRRASASFLQFAPISSSESACEEGPPIVTAEPDAPAEHRQIGRRSCAKVIGQTTMSRRLTVASRPPRGSGSRASPRCARSQPHDRLAAPAAARRRRGPDERLPSDFERIDAVGSAMFFNWVAPRSVTLRSSLPFTCR